MKKIYYAHHLFKYNTKVEEYELNLIKQEKPDYAIFNPRERIRQERTESEIMTDCIAAVKACDELVFSSMDGIVGQGCYDEIYTAYFNEKPIYYLHQNRLHKIVAEPVCFLKILSQNRSKRCFAYIENSILNEGRI